MLDYLHMLTSKFAVLLHWCKTPGKLLIGLCRCHFVIWYVCLFVDVLRWNISPSFLLSSVVEPCDTNCRWTLTVGESSLALTFFCPSAAENRLILDAFAQQCSRVLSLLNNGRLLEPSSSSSSSSSFTSSIKLEDGPAEVQGLHCTSQGTTKSEESSSTTDPEEEAPQSHLSQQQTSAVLRIFTDSLQNYLLSGPQQQQHLAARLEDEQCPSAEPGSGVSPPRHNLGGWGSPTPSDSYGHPSSTLPEEEEEEESCCPRCLELEQEVLSLQQENEELRSKLENIPGAVTRGRASQECD